jgi:UDP:flavonoid glycosyltransferase YjiC (YdhE family)
MARFTFAAFGSLGDLFPHLAVARVLAARGHRAIIATHVGHRAHVERAGLAFAPLRPDIADLGPDPRAILRRAMDPWRGSDYIFRHMALPWMRRTSEDVLAAADGADVLVAGALVMGAPAVAERLGIVHVPAVLQPLAMVSNMEPAVVPPFGWAPVRALRPWPGRLLWTLVRGMTAWLGRELNDIRRSWGLPPQRHHPFLAMPDHAPLILALWSRHFAPPPPDWPPRALATGFPFHDGDGEPGLDPALSAFLDAGDPPVAFTLGSSAVWVAGDFHAIAARAVARLGVRAVMLVGDEPSALPDPVPPGVHMTAYAPHAPLFERAGAIVHQGGIGTTAQALRSGRTQVVVPFSHDQPDNGARVARLGAGLVVGRVRLSERALARALARVLDDAAMRSRAAGLGQAIRGEHGTAVAADALERVAAGHAGVADPRAQHGLRPLRG